MEKGRLSSYADVERAVLASAALLWIAWNGEKIKAAAVTELGVANGEKFCTVVACGGHERGHRTLSFAGWAKPQAPALRHPHRREIQRGSVTLSVRSRESPVSRSLRYDERSRFMFRDSRR
jgi:hypothetical protein